MLLSLLPCVLGAWAPGAVRRAFYDTPKGALHYIVRGNVTSTPPLVFIHGHPRSTEQIKLFMEHVPASQPLLAVDYFGAGHSDECLCDEATDEFVPYTTFAQWVLEICDREGVGAMVPFGALTGASAAFELAYLAAKQNRTTALVQFESYYLSPRAKQYIDTVYLPSIRHLPLYANGSHLMYWWLKPDAGPIGPSNTSVVFPADVVANEQKTLDSLVNLRTGWQARARRRSRTSLEARRSRGRLRAARLRGRTQPLALTAGRAAHSVSPQFKTGWSVYNDLIPGRLSALVRSGVRQLYLDAGWADALGDKYGLDKTCARATTRPAARSAASRPRRSYQPCPRVLLPSPAAWCAGCVCVRRCPTATFRARRPSRVAGSRNQINAAVPATLRTNYVVANGTEGTLEQNATLCATVVRDFLGGWPPSK
jgi:pimeloyl-ACP methyl ester carboxylesterase